MIGLYRNVKLLNISCHLNNFWWVTYVTGCYRLTQHLSEGQDVSKRPRQKSFKKTMGFIKKIYSLYENNKRENVAQIM